MNTRISREVVWKGFSSHFEVLSQLHAQLQELNTRRADIEQQVETEKRIIEFAVGLPWNEIQSTFVADSPRNDTAGEITHCDTKQTPLPKEDTVRKVYDAILVPTEFTYACTEQQFREAVVEAELRGWMRSFHRGQAIGGQLCYQPTVQGFALAATLYSKLPKGFRDRISERNEALREESASIRKGFSERKQQKTS